MKKRSILAIAIVMTMVFSSCNSDDDNTVVTEPVESQQVSNLYAPQTGGQGQPTGGAFTKFDFETGMQTTSETDWDIAFRGTSIAVNGGTATGTADEPERNGNAGVSIATGTFDSVTSAEGFDFKQDSEGSYAISTGSDGWYAYNQTTHIISAIPGKVLVFRTHNGNYAKVEILSYYKDAPANPTLESESRYYTFNYVYNPNEGATNF